MQNKARLPILTMQTRASAPSAGFTLLELMVVLIILAMLASIVAPRVTHYLSRAKLETAQLQVNALGHAVDEYHLDTGEFPTNAEGLRSLIDAPPNSSSWGGPYVKKTQSLIDPWGRPYLYRYPGKHGRFDVYTLGPDPKFGKAQSAHEIGNW